MAQNRPSQKPSVASQLHNTVVVSSGRVAVAWRPVLCCWLQFSPPSVYGRTYLTMRPKQRFQARTNCRINGCGYDESRPTCRCRSTEKLMCTGLVFLISEADILSHFLTEKKNPNCLVISFAAGVHIAWAIQPRDSNLLGLAIGRLKIWFAPKTLGTIDRWFGMLSKSSGINSRCSFSFVRRCKHISSVLIIWYCLSLWPLQFSFLMRMCYLSVMVNNSICCLRL